MSSSIAPARSAHGVVRALCAGPVRTLRSPRAPGGPATTWRSAILKDPCTTPVAVGTLGLDGDQQKERRHHGGPSKAVLVYGAAHYARWTPLLSAHADAHADALRAMSSARDASVVGYGAFGENVTVDGLDESAVYLGDRWAIGTAVLQITEPRGPCATLTRRWMMPALLDEVRATAAAGWYNAVVQPGVMAPGDTVTLVERVQHSWTMARVFHLLEARVVSRADVTALLNTDVTPDTLRARLERRLRTPARLSD